MPLYFPVIICTVFLSFLSSPHAVIGSVFARVIIRTVVLIFTGRSDMVCAFPSLPTFLLPLPLLITYAWHYYIEHSPPFHLALPAIVTHHHQCILRYLHPLPSPLQMFSSSDLYRHYRDTISTRPFSR